MMRLTKEEIEDAKFNQEDACFKRETVIKKIKSIQKKLEQTRWEMTGERTVSYAKDPAQWRTTPIQDIIGSDKTKKSEESEYEQD